MKRKTILGLLFCLLISGNIWAQERTVMNLPKFDMDPYHFGFILGMNQMFFTVTPRPGYTKVAYSELQCPGLNLYGGTAQLLGIESKENFGFVIGIVSNLRMGNHFDLRLIPSLSFGEREMIYKIQIQKDTVPRVISKSIQSTFVEFPLYIRFKGKRINNTLPYVLGGAKYVIDLASNSKKKGSASDYNVAIQRSDVYGELGVGFDFYTAWFKFGTELKMSYGLLDMLKHDNTIYTDGIQKLNSRLFQLTFSFE